MNTDLVISTDMTADQERMLAEALGLVQDNGGDSNYLPRLKVNLDDEDGDGNELKRGTYYIAAKGTEPVYASKVTFRPLAQYFQWRRYDPELEKFTGRTLMVGHLSDEARDTDGTVKLGKPTSKQMQEDPSMKERFKNITCFRMVYGLVSYDGVTATGDKIKIEDQLVIFDLKGSNFSAFEDEVMKQVPNGKYVYNIEVEITNTRKKNGSVVYFVHNYKVLPDTLPLTPELLEHIKSVFSLVKEENATIEKLHTKALRDATHGRFIDDDSYDGAMNTIEASYKTMLNDLDDDIPEGMRG